MKNSKKYSLALAPTELQFKDLEKWLIKEQKSTGEGFYCNWKIIEKFFNNKSLVVLLSNNCTIGFACLAYPSERTSEITLFEIKPAFRRKGAGSYFTSHIFDFLVTKNMYVVELQCNPRESEMFWEKNGFMEMPTGINFFPDKHLYKTLIPSLKPLENYDGSTYVEIWDHEPLLTRNRPSKWKWVLDIDMETGKLKLPLIHPCNKRWRIRVIYKGNTLIDNKIKNFGNKEIVFGNFAVITQLS